MVKFIDIVTIPKIFNRTEQYQKMKISAAAFFQVASIASVSAFVVDPSSTQPTCLPLRMSDNDWDGPGPRKFVPTKKSEAIPFMNSPKLLDGTMAG